MSRKGRLRWRREGGEKGDGFCGVVDLSCEIWETGNRNEDIGKARGGIKGREKGICELSMRCAAESLTMGVMNMYKKNVKIGKLEPQLLESKIKMKNSSTRTNVRKLYSKVHHIITTQSRSCPSESRGLDTGYVISRTR